MLISIANIVCLIKTKQIIQKIKTQCKQKTKQKMHLKMETQGA